MGLLSILVAQWALTAVSLPTKSAAPNGVISAVSLRGNSPAPAPVSPAAPAAGEYKQNMTEDGRGPRGHFYYAESCEDCFYKSAFCGCKPAMEYFACLTNHCHAADASKFADKCAALESSCFADVDIECMGPKTVCTSKFNQLPFGGLGLSVILDDAEDKAYCGPFGKCIGKFRMKATIHRSVPYGSKAAAAPSPANAPAPVWLECGIPKKSVAEPAFEDKEDWITCQAQATGDVVGCDLPMRSGAALKAEQSEKGYCVLTDGQGGKQLTSPTWVVITNSHEKTAATKAAGTKVQKKEEKVQKKEEVPKVAKAEEKKEVPAEAEKQSPPKAEKQSKKEPAKDDNTEVGEPPWMENSDSKKPPPPI